ncbi:MAG TPA: Bax inhibitor-1/YccA family protein, partial [Methylomirabilota bacterium]|nr:Bax inhibitor-1/YccA family protein [Methylomirabilota bacterium]
MVNPERNAAARYGSVSREYAAEVDQGLRAYMLKVYNYMAIGLAVTGVVAFVAANAAIDASGQLTAFGAAIYTSPLRWVIMLAPLGAVFFLSFRIDRMSVVAAQGTFWAFAAIMGLSLSSIFLVYTGQSISQVFFVTAASFGALS